MNLYKARRVRNRFRSFLILLILATTLWAQRPAGEIRLEVKDPSGAANRVSWTINNPHIDRPILQKAFVQDQPEFLYAYDGCGSVIGTLNRAVPPGVSSAGRP